MAAAETAAGAALVRVEAAAAETGAAPEWVEGLEPCFAVASI